MGERKRVTIAELIDLRCSGWDAFLRGDPIDSCPYPIGSGDWRHFWMDGWLEAKHRRWQKIKDRVEITVG